MLLNFVNEFQANRMLDPDAGPPCAGNRNVERELDE